MGIGEIKRNALSDSSRNTNATTFATRFARRTLRNVGLTSFNTMHTNNNNSTFTAEEIAATAEKIKNTFTLPTNLVSQIATSVKAPMSATESDAGENGQIAKYGFLNTNKPFRPSRSVAPENARPLEGGNG